MSETTTVPNESAAVTEARVQSEQSKFVQHLATYPALTALAGLIASFPVAKIFVSNAVPLLHAIHERSKPVADPIAETAAPYLRKLDSAGDAALTRVDERFPKLKTVQPSEVYEGAHNYFDSVRDNAKATIDTRVTQPINNAARAAKTQYESIYDTRITSCVGPLNDRFESAIDEYLPVQSQSDEAPELEPSDGSQARRTLNLAKLAAERAAPRLRHVYLDKLSEKSGGKDKPGYLAKILAALATGKFLSVESYNLIFNHFGSSERLEAAVDEVKAKAEEYRRQTTAAAVAVVNEAEEAVTQ